MNLKDPETMNVVIGRVLRFGVLISVSVIILGTAGLAVTSGSTDTSVLFNYQPTIPHDGADASLAGLSGSLVELGVILLIATPVSRVLSSVLLFVVEKDTIYVVITLVVLILLLFSMLVTPFIPGFHA